MTTDLPISEMIRVKTEDMLLSMGVAPNLLGFRYIVDAVELAATKPDTLNMITKALYPAVAEKYGSTGSRVERAIRHVVEMIYSNADMKLLESTVGDIASYYRGKPTNGAFIAAMALKIKRNCVPEFTN